MFPLVPAYQGCPGSKAVKRSLLLLLLLSVVCHLCSGFSVLFYSVLFTILYCSSETCSETLFHFALLCRYM